jgi:hypothetical protein
MRSELNNFENIDRYISGEMSGAERSAFESQMAGDPALKSLVNDQQLFIQSVSRKALLAEINSVAMTAAVATTAVGGSGFFGGTFWVITSVLVVGGGATAGLVYFNQEDESASQQPIAQVEETGAAETVEMTGTKFFKTLTSEETQNSSSTSGDDRAPSRESFVEAEPEPDTPFSGEVNPGDNGSAEGSQDNDGSNTGSVISSDPNISSEFDGNNRTSELNTVNARINANAEFTGGTRALVNFLKKRVTYPETAKRRGIEARVRVEFWIDSEGRPDVLNIECLNLYDSETNKPLSGAASAFKASLKKNFEEKVRHTMEIMDPWQPETDQYGNPQQSEETWYFRFDIQDGIQFYNSEDF